MSFGVPLVLVLLFVGWWWLLRCFRPETKRLELNIAPVAVPRPKAMVFYGTFLATVVLWLTGKYHQMNAYVVAMLPLTVFFATGMLDKTDIRKFSWEVLWSIAGGIALGAGMSDSGLSSALMRMLSLESMSTGVLIGVLSLMAYVMANFVSNTATANLLLPLVVTVVTSLNDTASPKAAVIQVALTCSLGMALPISTPPNALAYATGTVSSRDLMRTGGVVSIVGFVLVAAGLKLFLFP